jgi:hypothetical protein
MRRFQKANGRLELAFFYKRGGESIFRARG